MLKDSEGVGIRIHDTPTTNRTQMSNTDMALIEILDIENNDASSKRTVSKRAKKKLRDFNKTEYTAEFDVPGDVKWCVGRVVELDASWRPKFFGNYVIYQVDHRIDESGYKCKLSLRKCLVGYEAAVRKSDVILK